MKTVISDAEEIDVIAPVLHELRAQGLQLTGPLPADTAFTSTLREKADVFVAMYHDQGLPVLKSGRFWRGDQHHARLAFCTHLGRSRHRFRFGWHRARATQ